MPPWSTASGGGGAPLRVASPPPIKLALGIDAGTLDGYDSLAFVLASSKGQNNGVAPLDGSGYVPTAHIPALAISELDTVASQAAMLALSAEPGDLAIRTDFDPDRVYMLTGSDPSVLANWTRVTFGDVVSVNGQTGVITLVAADVGALPASHGGSRDGHPLATATLDGFMSGLDKAKLDGIPGWGSGGLTFTEVEIDLGTTLKKSGKFNITSSGLTTGRHVLIRQANGPYTGKGTLADEAEMDSISVTGKTTSATNIECFWNSRTFVKVNFKFAYAVG